MTWIRGECCGSSSAMSRATDTRPSSWLLACPTSGGPRRSPISAQDARAALLLGWRWGGELEAVLPDELFIEAVLGRFTSSGEVVLAAAGGAGPILRRSQAELPEFHSLSGCLLGLELEAGTSAPGAWMMVTSC